MLVALGGATQEVRLFNEAVGHLHRDRIPDTGANTVPGAEMLQPLGSAELRRFRVSLVREGYELDKEVSFFVPGLRQRVDVALSKREAFS